MRNILHMTAARLALLLFCFGCLQTTTHTFDFFRQWRQKKADIIWSRLIGPKTVADVHDALEGKTLITDLDRNMRHLFVNVRRYSMKRADMDQIFATNRAEGKMQPIIPPNQPFPCDLSYSRSTFPPTSVHQLRPGDIDIIASIGDSLSAGNGIMSDRVLHILNEFRAFSFSGGGYGDWRSYLTLPNILREFNPNLYGYSTENELTVDSTSRLNIAEPMIMSRDLPFQARVLIDRMRQDPNVDMENHWKLLTIFVGNNDICTDMCHYDNMTEFVRRHEIDMRQTFTLLRDNVPRLLINLIPVPNMVISLYPMENKVPFRCFAVHHLGCHCIFSHAVGEKELHQAYDRINRWHEVDQYVAQLPEFQTNDFAVVYQPFTAYIQTPRLANGETDFRYFASDCFHFSQWGHASMSNSLWNSMLQPMGRKQLNMVPAFSHFECPTEERPYIATLYNSWQRK
ncbi:phospholipase B1, membrane-associated [Ceratitis capitata]|uniref:Phospholipase B1, membrane-associated n=1 Tax=Ceratitis capitata TaxID=7213 RepID=W8BWS9_CERCA|nr:phospholipase B1, membrane-associated [Ceratitis capitata]